MLPSYCFDYIFVHLRQITRLRPELSLKFWSTLGPNPARKDRPNLQLCLNPLDLAKWIYAQKQAQVFTTTLIAFMMIWVQPVPWSVITLLRLRVRRYKATTIFAWCLWASSKFTWEKGPKSQPKNLENGQPLSGCRLVLRIAALSFSWDRRMKMHQSLSSTSSKYFSGSISWGYAVYQENLKWD